MRPSAYIFIAAAFLAACAGGGGIAANPGATPSPHTTPSASPSASPTPLPTLAANIFHLSAGFDPGSQGRGSIVAGPDGNLWITECPGPAGSGSGRIGRITTSGVLTEYALTGGSTRCPSQITIGPDHALWFTENPTAELGRIDTLGNISEYPLPASDISGGSIALGSDGNLWYDMQNVDGAGDSAIRSFSPITHAVIDNVIIPAPTIPETLVSNPVDGSLIAGTLINQGNGTSNILQVVPGTSGTYAVKYSPSNANSGDWSHLALGSDGNIYVQFVPAPATGNSPGLAHINESTYNVTLFTETQFAGGPGGSTAFRGPITFGPDANVFAWDGNPKSSNFGAAELSSIGILLAQQIDGNNFHDVESGAAVGSDGKIWVAIWNGLAPSGSVYQLTPVH